MKSILTLVASLYMVAVSAQPFLIGSRTITFNDPARNRNIGTEVYYPGTNSGSNATVAQGEFPVLVMGHGFAMGVGAYSNLWEYFVPRGYIMVLPTTEGGLFPAPNHGAFGQDLAFLAQAMQAANLDPGSPFFGRVAPASALMGHSMGGGASFLGAANNGNIQALVNFAAAETNPSAIAAAANTTVPTMVIAGATDCVTPVDENQAPMYDALASTCRAFVNIIGGNHCQFAEYNFNCTFGEQTCAPGSPDISRGAQQSAAQDFAALWLDHFLKGLPGAFTALEDSLALSTRVTTEFTCLTTGVIDREAEGLLLAPVPAKDVLFVQGLEAGDALRVVDLLGREVYSSTATTDRWQLDVARFPAGTYRLLVERVGRSMNRAFVVAR